MAGGKIIYSHKNNGKVVYNKQWVQYINYIISLNHMNHGRQIGMIFQTMIIGLRGIFGRRGRRQKNQTVYNIAVRLQSSDHFNWLLQIQ